MGTGDIALPAFTALLQSGHEMVGLVTQPDKPVGRKQVLTPPRIKEAALEHGIPVWQPERARRKSFLDEMEALQPEVIIVMAYGQILTQRLIDAPSLAIINVHASLLPLYRGASCIQGPIADGHAETGVTIMHVVKALDAGDIILQSRTPLSPDDTGGAVHDRLAEMTPESLLTALDLLATGEATRTPQDDAASTYAPKLLRDHGLLDCTLPADQLERLIRAYHPWPSTYTTYLDKKGKSRRLKVFPPVLVTTSSQPEGTLTAEDGRLILSCANGTALELTSIQPDGSRAMPTTDFLLGGGAHLG